MVGASAGAVADSRVGPSVHVTIRDGRGEAANRVAIAFQRVSKLVDAFGWRRAVRLYVDERVRGRVQRVQARGAPPLWVRTGRGQSDVDTLLHIWRECCYQVQATSDPEWIIDAGANAGYATRWFAETFPTAKVIAIEPDPDNVELLRRNTEGLANVIIVPGALAATAGTATLVDVGEGPWSMRVGEAGAGAGEVVGSVPCVTVESLLMEHGIERIDYFKVDIEGGEIELFEGASAWIDKVDLVAVELHDRFRPGCMRAFIEATVGFDQEYSRGENSFAFRSAGALRVG